MSQYAIWGASLKKTVALQWGVVAGLSVFAWLLANHAAGLSLLCGGLAVTLPNTLLALWLMRRVARSETAGAMALMRGEMLKLGGTTALLVIVATKLKAVLVWPALLAGLLGALMAQWYALWLTRRY
jgi:F0F1-type ATP synthase assembly protein I